MKVSDLRSNAEEQLQYIARNIGSPGTQKHAVFEAVYFHKKPWKSVEEIMERTELDRQPVLKALAALHSADLIQRRNSNGVFEAGMLPNVKSLKNKALQLGGDKNKIEAIPTKRSAQPRARTSPLTKSVSRRSLKQRFGVAFFSSSPLDPKDGYILAVGKEARISQQAVEKSSGVRPVEFLVFPDADLNRMIEVLNRNMPRVVQFSGHGNGDGIEVTSGSSGKRTFIDTKFISSLLDALDSPPDLIIFNCCESEDVARSCIPPCKNAIGTVASIVDREAIAFSEGFFQALASGQSINSAFKQAQLMVRITLSLDADHPTNYILL